MPRTFDTREAFEEAYPNIKGSAIGPDGELIVLVTRKYDEDELADDEIVPDEVMIDGTTRKTDLIEVGIPHLISASGNVEWYATAPEDHRRRYRPIPGGVSIGNSSIGAGTMGSPLLETEDGSPVTLTNSHVAGGAIEQMQPSSMDGDGSPFGVLREASDLNPDEVQTTDSALINVNDESDISNEILGIGPLSGFDRADFTHDQYTKAGRTTGVTSAPLRGVDADVRVTYGPETILFEGCDVFGDLSAPGDSGSLIGYEDENNSMASEPGDGGSVMYTETEDGGLVATSLLFAGSSVATIGVPLSAVESEHGRLKIPDQGDDSGNSNGGNGSDDGSDDSSGDGSDDGSNGDSDDDDNGNQDHEPEMTFEEYVIEMLVEEYGKGNVQSQYRFPDNRRADIIAFDDENDRVYTCELENDSGSLLDGSGQALYYRQRGIDEWPEYNRVTAVLGFPDGHIDDDERVYLKRLGVELWEIETPENVSLKGV